MHSEATHASPLIFALAHDSRLTRLGCDWKKALWRDWPIYLHWAQNLISVLNRVLFCRVCVCSARCEGPTPQRGHDGRRLNQQNLYLLLITFAKCQPDTRSAILRVWVIAAAITGTDHLHLLLWTCRRYPKGYYMPWRNTIFEKYCMTGRVQEELSCQCNGYPAADDLDVLINSKCTPQVAIREVSKKLILSMAWLSPSSGRTSYRASKLKSGQKAAGRIALYGLVARSAPKECPRYLNCSTSMWYIQRPKTLIFINCPHILSYGHIWLKIRTQGIRYFYYSPSSS